MAKYQQVIQHIRSQREQGVLLAGEKLPSIRMLSQRLDVSLNTVIRGYRELEACGEINALARSGYRLQHREAKAKLPFAKPKSVDLFSLSRDVMSQALEKQLLPLGSAHPDIRFPAIKQLYAAIGRVSRNQSQTSSGYLLPPGDAKLRKQLSQLMLDDGLLLSPDEISITQGAQQGIYTSIKVLTKPGDIVAVESPCYFGTLLSLESLGLKALEIPSDLVLGMDIGALKQAISKWPVKLVITNPSFNNPSGSRIPNSQRRALLEATGDLPIIEDDVSGTLAYNSRPERLKSLDRQGRVIYASGLSKSLDSRLRIGWLSGGRYHQQINRELLIANMGGVNVTQSAVADFLSTGAYKLHLNKIRRTYQKRRDLFSRRMELELGDIAMTRPSGGFLCWLEMEQTTDGFQVYQQALEAGISLLPGRLFSSSDQYNHCLRFNFAQYEDSQPWHQGIARLANIITTNQE